MCFRSYFIFSSNCVPETSACRTLAGGFSAMDSGQFFLISFCLKKKFLLQVQSI